MSVQAVFAQVHDTATLLFAGAQQKMVVMLVAKGMSEKDAVAQVQRLQEAGGSIR